MMKQPCVHFTIISTIIIMIVHTQQLLQYDKLPKHELSHNQLCRQYSQDQCHLAKSVISMIHNLRTPHNQSISLPIGGMKPPKIDNVFQCLRKSNESEDIPPSECHIFNYLQIVIHDGRLIFACTLAWSDHTFRDSCDCGAS